MTHSNPTKPFRVAVAGLGEAGLHIHLPALSGLAGAELVGVCDPVIDRRREAMELHGSPTFVDLDAMLEETRPDVVIVATPPSTHADLCVRSLHAGAHVVCEKPFAASIEEAERVAAASSETGRIVALNHEFREMPIFRAVLEEAQRSEVLFAHAGQSVYLPRGQESGWRGRLRHRALYEAGVHLVDVLIALYQERPVAVSAAISACGRQEEADAVVVVTLEFPGDRLAHIVQNRLARGEPRYFELRAETGQGALCASFGGRMNLSAGFQRSSRPHLRLEYGWSGLAWHEKGTRRRVLARNGRHPRITATRRVLAGTFTALRKGEPPPIGAETGRDVLQVIAACYHAADTGRRVRLDAQTLEDLASMQLARPETGVDLAH